MDALEQTPGQRQIDELHGEGRSLFVLDGVSCYFFAVVRFGRVIPEYHTISRISTGRRRIMQSPIPYFFAVVMSRGRDPCLE